MVSPLAWPLTPVVGQVFKGFAWDGRTWDKAKPNLTAEWTNVQVFTASGRYTPSDDLIYAVVECVGPGGGGGWATLDVEGVTAYATAAGGGGSGGYSRSVLAADEVSQGADVVIGPGGIVGAGVIGGGKTSGSTSFGGLVVANGGGDARAFDGTGTLAAAHGLPGAGAALGTGDFCEPGACGGMFATIIVNIAAQHLTGARPGEGGQLFGGAAWPIVDITQSWLYSNNNGVNGAPNSGAGGGGAQVNTGSTPITMFGGAGGTGICVVTEICGTDDGGGPEPPTPGPGHPPGVPVRVNAKVAVTEVPWCPQPTGRR